LLIDEAKKKEACMTNSVADRRSVLDAVESFLELVSKKARWLAMFAVFAMAVLVCADVAGRLFGRGVPGALELLQNLLVLNTFALMALLQLQDHHMSIEFVYVRMNKFWQNWARVFVSLFSMVILGVLTYESAFSFIRKLGTKSMELYVPMEFYYWMPVLGMGLTFLVALYQSVRDIRRSAKDRQWISIASGIALPVFLTWLPFWYRNSHYDISNLMLGCFAFLLLFFLMFMKMPIGWAMSAIGAMGMIAVARNVPAAMATCGSTPYAAACSHNLAALPLFVLMGSLILYAGISEDLFDSANKWIGHLPGGMGMASVAGCTGFAAVCGDSMATAVTIGSVALPEMQRLKYDKALSSGALAAGGTLGILIPPSAGFIIYGIVTEVSIGRLFLAGIVPGLLLAGLFMVYIYITAIRHPEKAPRGPHYPFMDRVRSSVGLLPILSLFLLVLGSIVTGACSPTEGGAVGAAGAFLYILFRRRLTWKSFLGPLDDAAVLTARIMCIMVGVAVLGYFFAATRLPFLLADFIVALPFNRYVIFVIIIAIYVAGGCMMNVIPLLMLTLPSLFPTVLALGFDPVWFGVVTVMVMEMGQITPPVGVVVFALSGVAKGIPMETIFKGIVPFVGLILVGLAILTLFPNLATWLPYLMMGPELH
jgi:tripartite ATP-independent transporter DctM subunit